MEQEIARSVQDLLVKLSEECAARNWSAEDVFKRCVTSACANVSDGRLIAACAPCALIDARWDVNNDGDINVAEFRIGLKQIGIHLSPISYR